MKNLTTVDYSSMYHQAYFFMKFSAHYVHPTFRIRQNMVTMRNATKMVKNFMALPL